MLKEDNLLDLLTLVEANSRYGDTGDSGAWDKSFSDMEDFLTVIDTKIISILKTLPKKKCLLEVQSHGGRFSGTNSDRVRKVNIIGEGNDYINGKFNEILGNKLFLRHLLLDDMTEDDIKYLEEDFCGDFEEYLEDGAIYVEDVIVCCTEKNTLRIYMNYNSQSIVTFSYYIVEKSHMLRNFNPNKEFNETRLYLEDIEEYEVDFSKIKNKLLKKANSLKNYCVELHNIKYTGYKTFNQAKKKLGLKKVLELYDKDEFATDIDSIF